MLSRQMKSIFGLGCNSRRFQISKLLYSAAVIDGKGIAAEIKQELKVSVDSWVRSGRRRPKLAALLVGNHQASKIYVNNKVKAAESVGIDSETVLCSENITQLELIDKINALNRNSSVDGILVQLPLPKGLDEREVCHAVAPYKDVDGFHVENMGKLSLGNGGIIPATALAVRELIIRTKIETRGKNAVVVGRSKHVGLPISLLLHANGTGKIKALDMTTTICHRYTPHVQLEKFTQLADVIVVAAGIPGLLTKEMVKPGACVIDVGITRVKDMQGNFKLVGDVDFDEVKDIADYITPVPGGVGPMTVAMLLRNTLLAARKEVRTAFREYLNCVKRATSTASKMSRPKVFVTHPEIPGIGFDLLRKECDVIVWDRPDPISRAKLKEKIAGVDALYCLLTNKIDDEVLQAAGPQLKVVATMSVGYDHLDLEALKTRNIHIGYTPGVLTNATAELTVALLLATSRRLLEAHREILRGNWTTWGPSWMCGFGLTGSTVGIVGLGRIGIRVAEMIRNFNVARILYTSRSEKKEAAKFQGQKVDIDQLVRESDCIIVTIAFTPETKEMFNKQIFDKMKRTAVFINTSRGAIVDQSALVEALKNGTIRAAGLDVMTPEPIPLDNDLLKLNNCVVLPHIGSACIQTRAEMARMTAENILAVLRGSPEQMPAPLLP